MKKPNIGTRTAILLRLTPELYKKFKILCIENGEKPTNLLRDMIEEKIKDGESKC